MVKDDERTDTLQLSFMGGPCDGRTAVVDPKDACHRIEAAPHQSGAVVLGRLALPGTEPALQARGLWELYQRDDEDPFLYRHVPDDAAEYLYDPENSGDEWVWPGWGDRNPRP